MTRFFSPDWLQVRTTGCLMQRGQSEDPSPSGLWVFQCLGSRLLFAGARTPPTTPTSSSLAATGDSAPWRTAWSPSTHVACKTGAASLKMLMLLSGTFMVRKLRNYTYAWQGCRFFPFHFGFANNFSNKNHLNYSCFV